MSKKQMTLVYYYIPQDHDDQQTPNVFGVMIGKSNIRLSHIYENFPLKGSYIFRFKVMYDNAIAWLDLPELDTKIPTYKDKIVIKATRISWQTNKHNPYGHYRFVKKQHSTVPNTQAQTQPNPQKKQQTQAPPQQSMFQIKKQKSPIKVAAPKVETADLLSQKHQTGNNKTNSSNVISDFDLLSGTTSSTTNPTQNKTNNLGADLGDLI